jgi:iron complex transport system ATP-binding protein
VAGAEDAEGIAVSFVGVSGLSVSLGGRTVLRDISFAAGRGELIGLVGPNGAGKSTLLKAMLGLAPASGGVSLAGGDPRAMPVRRRAALAAYLPQEREIAWALTAREVVGLGRIPHRAAFAPPTPVDHAATEAAMRLADVAGIAGRRVSELSGGECARVLIARALAQSAPVLLADEPVAGLDPAHQIALMDILSGLAAEGRTVIVTLHELHLAARWCGRILLLDQGALIADGEPVAVLTQERLAAIYGVRSYFATSEGKPVITPIARLDSQRASPDRSE